MNTYLLYEISTGKKEIGQKLILTFVTTLGVMVVA